MVLWFVGLGLGDKRLGLLLVVQGLEDLVGLLALIPPDVVRVLGVLVVVAVGGVAVEDRPAERGAFDAVAVGAERVVPAGQDPLKRLVGPRLAEDGHVVGVESAGVVVHLLHEPLVAILAAEVLHDLPAEGLAARSSGRSIDGLTIAQLLPTLFRRGWSNGKQSTLRCSGVIVL